MTKRINSLLQRFNTPFQAPDFKAILVSDYMPAFVEGMESHLAEIDLIANNPEPATFAKDRKSVV